MNHRTIALATAIVVLPTLAAAQGAHGGHFGHSTPAQAARTPDMPATQGYRQANEKMHKNMDIAFSGNADIDFVRSMIPHHEGAIDMAKVALQHAKDEQVRKWAQDVIREQEREIAEMQTWLKSKGVQ
ncbi:CopM family metallochaperone [Microvirga sp. CF3062]|uniref:CopM family metallochaperone n=1 Tax=Microvirga sp. CF3062 TaxID=3110182 RepID=UPI003FA5D6CF